MHHIMLHYHKMVKYIYGDQCIHQCNIKNHDFKCFKKLCIDSIDDNHGIKSISSISNELSLKHAKLV